MAPRGGARPGSGRKAPEGVRKMRSMRALDDEWALIQQLAELVKSGKAEECREFVERALKEKLGVNP